jgi:hypothetical protein
MLKAMFSFSGAKNTMAMRGLAGKLGTTFSKFSLVFVAV